MRIGLLSDTHGYLDPKVFEHFANCDEVWHAGDIGSAGVADELQQFKALRAVHGNIDDRELCARFPEDQWIQTEGLTIWITHIGGTPRNYNTRVKKILSEKTPDLFICGHSHILKIERDQKHNNMLYLNPGAAGHQAFHHMRTLVRFEITQGEFRNMEVIELGRRGAV